MACEHIRYRIRPAPGWRAWRGALGLRLAPFISSALGDWEARVTGKGDVPCGARAAEVGGAPPCLVELRMPAGSAEPWLRTQPQPRSRRPFRPKTQNMPLCWPRPSRASCRLLSQLRPRTSGGRPYAASGNSGAVQTRGWPAPGAGRVRFGRASRCPGGIPGRRMRRRPGIAARCRGATRHLGPLLSGCTVRPRRTR